MSATEKTIEQQKGIDGVVKITQTHKIVETKQRVELCWPKFPIDEWERILSFFKWTQDTYHSESQVRLYVNPRTNTWKAWAFPQTARGGMATREMETPETAVQRQLFPDSEGWTYFGTVHHHCEASAFASGTDTANEENQDGIHITVGHITKPVKDIHMRLILLRQKTDDKDFDASQFIDISTNPDIASTPERFRESIIAIHGDSIARGILKGARDDREFPDVWRTNMVHVQTTSYPGNGPGAGSGHAAGSGSGYGYSRHNQEHCSGDMFDRDERGRFVSTGNQVGPTKWAQPDVRARWLVRAALVDLVKSYRIADTEQLIDLFADSISIGWINGLFSNMAQLDMEPLLFHRTVTHGTMRYDYVNEKALTESGVDIEVAVDIICDHKWPQSAVSLPAESDEIPARMLTQCATTGGLQSDHYGAEG